MARAREVGGCALVAFGTALLQWRLIVMVLGRDFGRSVEAAEGILRGLPHWRVYQGRLLGPQLVEWIAGLTGASFLDAHIVFSVGMLTLAGCLVLDFTRRNTGDVARALAAFGVFHLLVAMLLGRPWLYVWDHLGLVLFVIFNQLVIRGAATRWFALLWAFAIFNRESAHFIALWLVLGPLLPFAWERLRGRAAGLDWARVATGVVLLVGGVLLIEQLREQLMVKEMAAEIFDDYEPSGGAFHFRLASNLEIVGTLLTNRDILVQQLLLALMGGTLVFGYFLARADIERYLGLAVVHAGMLASILLFGHLLESRVFLEVVPFLAMNLWAAFPGSDDA